MIKLNLKKEKTEIIKQPHNRAKSPLSFGFAQIIKYSLIIYVNTTIHLKSYLNVHNIDIKNRVQDNTRFTQ